MALITCPECGQSISDKSDACIHCGCPITPAKGELIIYGIKQNFLVMGKVKVLLDEVHIATVDKGQKVVIPIEKDCCLTVKCGLSTSRGNRLVRAGQTTKIQVLYNRLTGYLQLNEIE